MKTQKINLKKGFYDKFTKEELILRDHLAIDRTVLSNESTFLAYIRTSLAVIAAGGTLIHFFLEAYIKLFGGFLILSGIFIFLWGYRRFKQMDKEIKKIRKR